MALKRSFTLGDVVYPEAYSRIACVTLDSKYGGITVVTYANQADREANERPIATEAIVTYPANLVGDVYKLAYDIVRSRPGFTEAVVTPDGDDVKPLTRPSDPDPIPAG